MPKRASKAGKHVAVDTGMLLVIDPGYLFTEDEWQEVNALAISHGNDWPRAVLEILGQRTGRDLSGISAVVNTCGDGYFGVSEKKGYFKVETNCIRLRR
jgi:hypothetical protein